MSFAKIVTYTDPLKFFQQIALKKLYLSGQKVNNLVWEVINCD